jgi:hypothetical protein
MIATIASANVPKIGTKNMSCRELLRVSPERFFYINKKMQFTAKAQSTLRYAKGVLNKRQRIEGGKG